MTRIIFLLLICILCQCRHSSTVQKSNFNLDHFLIWTENPKHMKAKFEDIGFAVVPDSMSAIHEGQGTSGRYFNFLNGYFEIIFVHDSIEFRQNARTNNSLDFKERQSHQKNGFNPFGIALNMKNYHPDSIPFETVEYHQEWMGDGNSIYMAKASKTYKEEPSVFVVYPSIVSPQYEHIDSLRQIPDQYVTWRNTYLHPNGAQKVTNLVYTIKTGKKQSRVLSALKSINSIEFKEGENYLLEIYFDNHKQGKVYDLGPELPIKVYL